MLIQWTIVLSKLPTELYMSFLSHQVHVIDTSKWYITKMSHWFYNYHGLPVVQPILWTLSTFRHHCEQCFLCSLFSAWARWMVHAETCSSFQIGIFHLASSFCIFQEEMIPWPLDATNNNINSYYKNNNNNYYYF